MSRQDRRQHARQFGPTTGDRVRLADTELIVEVEEDKTVIGEAALFGSGKTIRDGMAQSTAVRAEGAVDLVITDVLILDHSGIVKADIGVKDGRIAGIGKAGNPDTMDGVAIQIGASTDVLAGEGSIVTAGGVDPHVHYVEPQQAEHALASGITTRLGGGTGPVTGSVATTCTPGEWNLARMLEYADEVPLNLGFFGKGNSSKPDALREQVAAGACGLKLHEDWASTPQAIRTCLAVGDETGVQVPIHTDSLNEAGFVGDTAAAFEGRTIHTYHTEGAGGGHAPDIMRLAGMGNVLPSSTSPTRPYTTDTVDEHVPMVMVVHSLNPNVPEDVALAESRVRAETIAAEDILHDIGALSMMSSDSQAMGRAAEVWSRTFQTADKMKRQRGRLPEDTHYHDNHRVKRYLAKCTINPAITHGISGHVGSVEEDKLADLVVWQPAFFAVKPSYIIKGGLVARAAVGDPNASVPSPAPVLSRPMFGSHCKTAQATSLTFVSLEAAENGLAGRLGLGKEAVPVQGTRSLSKSDMVHNDYVGQIEVDPETYEVKVDGEYITCEPAAEISLAQRYFLF